MDEQTEVEGSARGRWVLPPWLTTRFLFTSSAGAFAVWLGVFFIANGTVSDTGDTWVHKAVNSATYWSFSKVIVGYFAIGVVVTFIQERVARPPVQSANAQRATKAVGSVTKVAVIGVGIFLALAFLTLLAIAIAAGM